jgi:hypothetical protein
VFKIILKTGTHIEIASLAEVTLSQAEGFAMTVCRNDIRFSVYFFASITAGESNANARKGGKYGDKDSNI